MKRVPGLLYQGALAATTEIIEQMTAVVTTSKIQT